MKDEKVTMGKIGGEKKKKKRKRNCQDKEKEGLKSCEN